MQRGTGAPCGLSLLSALPVLLFAALAGVLLLALLQGGPKPVPSVLTAQPAPATDLPGLPGRPGAGLSNTDLRSGKPVLVNVWASWCAPCKLEHPVLSALAREGLTIHGINYRDRPGPALAFLRQLGDPYTRIGVDESGRASLDWGVYGVPETFVLDGEGRILARHAGAVDETVLEEVIRPALAAAAAAGASPQGAAVDAAQDSPSRHAQP